MISVTTLVAVTGVTYKIAQVNATENTDFSNVIIGQDDLLEQGGSIETVLLSDPTVGGLQTFFYTVQDDDTMDSIAENFNVTKDTIRWANTKIGTIAFSDKLQKGWELTIPSINGVIYEVKKGDSLDSIINIASVDNNEANRFNIIEFNNLVEPYELTPGQKLFIPDGNLKRNMVDSSVDIPMGVFIDPLSNPVCNGYTFSRGFLSYHNGVDLAKWDGCPIEAVANGVITYAGWGNGGQGFWVEVDHGGGIVTQYFHGDGTIFVKKGDWVEQGTPIMMMGNTGNSTGTHLHFSLWKDGKAVNPNGYIPYNGDY